MKKNIYVVSTNIISPLGNTSEQNFMQLEKGISGIQLHNNTDIWPEEFHASLFETAFKNKLINSFDSKYSIFESLLIESITTSLKDCSVDIKSKRTVIIISTTKGNISFLEEDNYRGFERISLHHSAKEVAEYFGNPNTPIIVSNACISGVLAIVTGRRLIQSGMYDNVVVAGADLITKFILSGFYSFQAISDKPCKPFDKTRNGVTLGEAAGTIILSAFSDDILDAICVTGGSVTNDANHISGPSRTGEELSYAINKTIEEAAIKNSEVDFISLHGTATIYNDEMEGNAVTLSNLQDIPANSMKGYFGHTLGSAGIIESVISIYSMKNNLIIPTIGYSEYGLTKQINISNTFQKKPLYNCLKTASGFGGCNASLLLSKK